MPARADKEEDMETTDIMIRQRRALRYIRACRRRQARKRQWDARVERLAKGSAVLLVLALAVKLGSLL